MVIIETSVFTRLINDLLGDDDYRELQHTLVQHPDLGDLIRVRVNGPEYVLFITG
jgi:hypothetical protein